MGCGKKAASEDAMEQAFEEHIKRLEEVGIPRIAGIIDVLNSDINRLEELDLPLNKHGHYLLSSLKDCIKQLR